jgi:phosphopantothenoylcysteine synthetase/decarboxylase
VRGKDAKPAIVRGPLGGRTVALCVTGSIAAYKAVELARLLVKGGAKVLPVMTASATNFVGPVTFAGICGEPVVSGMWDASFPGEVHVSLAARADVVAIVPATADVLARLAQGRADDVVTALALCARGPVVAAPAMHPRMWDHPATVTNIATLASQARVTLVGPVSGEVASGDVGMGRMAEPEAIAAAVAALLVPGDPFGTLTVQGNYTQTATGVLLIQIAGPNQYGQLAVTGSATLDGTLQVSRLGTYVPAIGASFQILTFANYTGGFSTEVGLNLPHHRSLKPVWDSDGLALTVE